jgi:6-phospho-3-hexuloisomerase
MDAQSAFPNVCRLIVDEIGSALDHVDSDQAAALVEAILGAEQVFVIGVGRVMLSLAAFAKRLNHLGLSAHCVGDINEPAITNRDLLVVASGSGESVVPVAIAKVAKGHGAKIAYVGSNLQSTVAALADVLLRIPVATKLHRPDELPSRQIMTSLFEQAVYVFGDALALEIARRQNVDIQQLRRFHANLE